MVPDGGDLHASEASNLLLASITNLQALQQRQMPQLPFLDQLSQLHKHTPPADAEACSASTIVCRGPLSPSLGSQNAPQDSPSTSQPACQDVGAADFSIKGRRQQRAQPHFFASFPFADALPYFTNGESRVTNAAAVLLLLQQHAKGLAQQLEAQRKRLFRAINARRGQPGDDGPPVHHTVSRAERRAQHKLFEQALALERALNPAGAAQIFEELATKHGEVRGDIFARWAKNLSDMTYMDHMDKAKIMEANSRAIEIAHRSCELAPSSALGPIARCVSRGRLAVFQDDNKAKVQLAKDASDDAKLALQLDPSNDLAHHLMGRWHYEMAGINFVVRTIIKLLYGTALMQGSYHEAVHCYERASQLAPQRLVHRVELGRCLSKVGDVRRAIKELESSLDMEVEDLNAHLTRIDATSLLEQLRRSGAHSSWFSLPAPSGSSRDTSGGGSSSSGAGGEESKGKGGGGASQA